MHLGLGITLALLSIRSWSCHSFALSTTTTTTVPNSDENSWHNNANTAAAADGEKTRRVNTDNDNDNDDTIIFTTMTAASASTKLRSVRKVLPRPRAHWVGDGFRVYPVFADLAFTNDISPLLMFDYAEPKTFPAKKNGKPLGVGQHPHRGFETVTVAFRGEVEHHDNKGGSGIIKPGDVQWMTAGRGIVHQEYHSKEFTKSGGTLEMCQLWVNLPAKDKMVKPNYQPIPGAKIPQVPLPLGVDDDDGDGAILGTARIIAGQLGETMGAAKTFSPVQMWDVRLPKKGSVVDIPFPKDHNCIVFVRAGAVQVLSSSSSGEEEEKKEKSYDLGPQDVALMNLDSDSGDALRVRVVKPDSSILILGGEPLNEPIANHGPFVMNTEEQISRAFTDYRMGKF